MKSVSRKKTQKNESTYVNFPGMIGIREKVVLLFVVIIESCFPNIPHDENEKKLDVVRHIWNQREQSPFTLL